MSRTIINLDPEDKQWLDRQARARHVPMTALVREAVREYRVRQQSRDRPGLAATLSRTAGIRHGEDALAWQRRIRDEWDRGR